MKKIFAAGATVAALALAGCGGGSHGSGSPKPGSGSPTAGAGSLSAAALAAKLGCKVAGTAHDQVAVHDTVQYANVSGGPCSSGTDVDSQGLIIITFASGAKQADWLRQNAAGQKSSPATGYFEVVSGHLWAVTSGGNGGFDTAYILQKLGGNDTTF
jgi:hypothetical protein